jgi:O-antigen/teichoic acid export membrane protein
MPEREMIGRNALVQLFATCLNGLIAFFILSFSARLFGPEIVGHLAYLFGLTGLIFAFSDLGFSRAHVHYSSQTRQPGRNLRVFLTIKLILLLFSALIASLYFYFQSNQLWFLFFLVVTTEIFSRLADSILITFEALQRVFPQNLVKLIAKLVKLLSLIILAQVLRSEVGYGLTYFAEAVTLVFLAACLLTRFLPLSFDRPLLKEYLIYSLPFFVIIPLSYFQDNSSARCPSRLLLGLSELNWFCKVSLCRPHAFLFSSRFQTLCYPKNNRYANLH